MELAIFNDLCFCQSDFDTEPPLDTTNPQNAHFTNIFVMIFHKYQLWTEPRVVRALSITASFLGILLAVHKQCCSLFSNTRCIYYLVTELIKQTQLLMAVRFFRSFSIILVSLVTGALPRLLSPLSCSLISHGFSASALQTYKSQ